MNHVKNFLMPSKTKGYLCVLLNILCVIPYFLPPIPYFYPFIIAIFVIVDTYIVAVITYPIHNFLSPISLYPTLTISDVLVIVVWMYFLSCVLLAI